MEKKYTIIAKVSNEQFVKYHVNNLLSFTKFLDEKFPDWRYYNVFDKAGQQLTNFTKNSRPQQKTL
jgi:hypothetical protein